MQRTTGVGRGPFPSSVSRWEPCPGPHLDYSLVRPSAKDPVQLCLNSWPIEAVITNVCYFKPLNLWWPCSKKWILLICLGLNLSSRCFLSVCPICTCFSFSLFLSSFGLTVFYVPFYLLSWLIAINFYLLIYLRVCFTVHNYTSLSQSAFKLCYTASSI